MTTAAQLRDRVSGSLYGLLVGDALGCPVEGMSAQAIASQHGVLDEMLEGDRWWRPAGLHSDDGQQAIALLDAVLTNPLSPVRPFAQALVALRQAGPGGYRKFGLHRGTGGNFRRTVMALMKDPALDDDSVDAAALFQHATVTAGNGAAMRVAPLALFFRDDDDAMLHAIITTARLTHEDARGVSAAAAVAWVVKEALHLSPSSSSSSSSSSRPILEAIGTHDLLEFVRRAETVCERAFTTEKHATGMSDALVEILPHLHDDVPALCERIVDVVASQSDRPVGAGAGFAPASATLSICIALRSHTFEQAIVDVIAAGDDTDTTAAMVGQMVGAATGRSAIPARWLSKLWARGVLEDRIDALASRRVPFVPGFSLVELETPWTEALYLGQQARRSTTSNTQGQSLADAPEDAHELALAPAVEDPIETDDVAINAGVADAGVAAEDDVVDDEQPFWMSMADNDDVQKPDDDVVSTSPLTPAQEVAQERARQQDVARRASTTTPPSAPPSSSPSATPPRESPSSNNGVEQPQAQMSIFDVAPPRHIGSQQPADAKPREPAPPTTLPTSSPAPVTAPADIVDEGTRLSSGLLLKLVKGDITKTSTDVIVNAANTSLLGGGGVDGAIHRAGGPEILDDCRSIRARQGGCKTGEAVITCAGRLPAKNVIHTVGPRWRGGEHNEEALLANAYRNTLRLARENGLKRIAFPSISTGVYNFPIERAARIALHEIASAAEQHPGSIDEVKMVLFEAPDLWIYQKARRELVSA